MVSIPPTVVPFGIVAVTYLFGTIVIIFAAPIAVPIFAGVDRLPGRGTLDEKNDLAGKLAKAKRAPADRATTQLTEIPLLFAECRARMPAGFTLVLYNLSRRRR